MAVMLAAVLLLGAAMPQDLDAADASGGSIELTEIADPRNLVPAEGGGYHVRPGSVPRRAAKTCTLDKAKAAALVAVLVKAKPDTREEKTISTDMVISIQMSGAGSDVIAVLSPLEYAAQTGGEQQIFLQRKPMLLAKPEQAAITGIVTAAGCAPATGVVR